MYASNNNAFLINNCEILENLSVLLEVTEDVATTDNGGWSFQLNCYPPPGEYCQTSNVNWMQYIVYVMDGELRYEIQYWAIGASTWPTGYQPQQGTTPWLPCWPNDYYLSGSFAGINGDTLPRQSQLQIALTTNGYGGVTKATFTYTDPDGNEHTAENDLPAVHPIDACTLNLVGPGGGGGSTFTQGLLNSRGIIYYTISSGALSVQNGGAGAACGEVGGWTAETSNMTYSDISGAPGSTVTQILQQPVDCSLNDLFGKTSTKLEPLRRVRDAQVARQPAGQWLTQLLDQHAADLAVFLGASDGDYQERVRRLLEQTARAAEAGKAIDSAAVDEGLRLVREAAADLPPSMSAARAPVETVLEAVRGRTLQDGLREASRTIRPSSRGKRGPCAGCSGCRCEELERRVSALEAEVARMTSSASG